MTYESRCYFRQQCLSFRLLSWFKMTCNKARLMSLVVSNSVVDQQRQTKSTPLDFRCPSWPQYLGSTTRSTSKCTQWEASVVAQNRSQTIPHSVCKKTIGPAGSQLRVKVRVGWCGYPPATGGLFTYAPVPHSYQVDLGWIPAVTHWSHRWNPDNNITCNFTQVFKSSTSKWC